MSKFDIENLKNTWQNQQVKPKYNTHEILQMLNKKSRNYVKYIYWVSLVEFILFFAITLFYVFKGNENEPFYQLMATLGIEKNSNIEANFENLHFLLEIVSIIIGAFFVIRFYLQMKKVHCEDNLKKFISKIIAFRKTVRAFIIANIVVIACYFVLVIIGIRYLINEQNIELSSSVKTGLLIAVIVAILVSGIMIWLYYKIIYGILLNRLNTTLKQLQDIEKQ
ncbi:MAG: beta-carotene 15,15'-monooxygenase [Flavobacteriales bacterium]|nr:MAG: beta-carotene 15,15'-monooxygenase [Flavobacteriales bacterium]